MDSDRAASTPASAPLATYAERLLEVRRDFTLYPDRVVVRARWLLRGRHEHVVPLSSLRRDTKRLVIRYRMYRYAGWVLALGSLGFAALYYEAEGRPLGLPSLVTLAVAGFGAAALVLTYPLRRLEFVRFDTRSGRPGLDIGASGKKDPKLNEFVRAVQRQIERQ